MTRRREPGKIEVESGAGRVLLSFAEDDRSSLHLDVEEVIDLARRLIAAAVAASPRSSDRARPPARRDGS
jgi:hypothetical protein